MNEILQKIMGITIVIFMVGNLLEVGLRAVVRKRMADIKAAASSNVEREFNHAIATKTHCH